MVRVRKRLPRRRCCLPSLIAAGLAVGRPGSWAQGPAGAARGSRSTGEDPGGLPQDPLRLGGGRDGAGAGGPDRAGDRGGRRRGPKTRKGSLQGRAGGHPRGRRHQPRGPGADRHAPPRGLPPLSGERRTRRRRRPRACPRAWPATWPSSTASSRAAKGPPWWRAAC